MPTYPIIERIAQAIETQLATITAAGGYAVTVAEVLRPTRTGVSISPASYGIVMLQGDADREEELDVVGNPPGIAWRQTWWLDLCLRPSDAAATPIDQLANIFWAEVTKAMLADPQWAGLAIDTHVGEPEYGRAADGSYEGVTAAYEIIYRVAEDDPDTQV